MTLASEVLAIIPEFLGRREFWESVRSDSTKFEERAAGSEMHVDLAATSQLILVHTPHWRTSSKGTRMIFGCAEE